MPSPFVICLGEAMVELSLSSQDPQNARIGFAGDTLNTAIYLKRALPDAKIAYATKVGQDDFSTQMTQMMAAEGLDTSLVFQSADRTCGLYAIKTDAAGERSFSYWRSASAARQVIQPPGLEPKHLADADLVYLSAISLAILPRADRAQLMSWLADYRRQGGRVAFDSNYRAALWPDADEAKAAIEAAWRVTDLGLPSVDDEQAVFGDADDSAVVERLQSFGLREGALKRGPLGPCPILGTSSAVFAPADKVIDSTAAGDSFNAAYLAAHLSNQSNDDCMQAGHDLASRVIGVRGAIIQR